MRLEFKRLISFPFCPLQGLSVLHQWMSWHRSQGNFYSITETVDIPKEIREVSPHLQNVLQFGIALH